MVESPSKEENEERVGEWDEIDEEFHSIELAIARQSEPYSSIEARLDALLVRCPDAAIGVIELQLAAASIYKQPELTQILESYLKAEPLLWRRLQAALAECHSPELFTHFALPLIAEAEAVAEPDDALSNVLAAARRNAKKLGV